MGPGPNRESRGRDRRPLRRLALAASLVTFALVAGAAPASGALAAVVENLNPVLRGWGTYFRYGNSGQKFDAIDQYVNQRLAMLASAKHGLQGRNWVSRFNHESATRIGVYRLSGTVRSTRAYASGERCR